MEKRWALLIGHGTALFLVSLSLMVFVSNCVWAIIEVEHVDIGNGGGCFSFAIFADPQITNNIAKLEEAIDTVNIFYPDAKFVIILGDLIQGEEATPSAYETQFSLVKHKLNNLNLPYIPVIGNHDVWCNLTTNDISFPSNYTIPPYDPGDTPRYPEQIFNEIFEDVYDSLSIKLPGWTKQDDTLPIDPNPYDDGTHPLPFPSIHFQNFAFDFGPYHFICLDFCSRKDFDDIEYFSVPFVGDIPIFGYADVHDFTDGTLDWLDNHLASLSPQQRKNIVIFAHHPVIYKLQMLFITLEGDNTFAFDELIEGEYTSLKNLFDGYDCQFIHWFSGHYHLKGSDWGGSMNVIWWHDDQIGGDISIIPSTMAWSELGGISIPQGTPVTINDTHHDGTFEPNPNGCLAIVNVFVEAEFIRGDCNGDGIVDTMDAICITEWHSGGDPLSCWDAADANDDGVVNLGDSIYIMHFAEGSGPPPPSPYPDCGPDTTPDDLDCEEHYFCDSIAAGIHSYEEGLILDRTLALSQNFPNPFNSITQINYALPQDCHVKLDVYNILGQKVTTLVDGKQKTGSKTVRWDAGSLSSGIYFYRLQAGDFVKKRKMILLK